MAAPAPKVGSAVPGYKGCFSIESFIERTGVKIGGKRKHVVLRSGILDGRSGFVSNTLPGMRIQATQASPELLFEGPGQAQYVLKINQITLLRTKFMHEGEQLALALSRTVVVFLQDCRYVLGDQVKTVKSGSFFSAKMGGTIIL